MTTVSPDKDEVERDLVRRSKMVALRCASLAAKTPVAGQPDPDWWERQSALGDAADKIHELVAAMSPVDRLREALAEAREAIASLDDDALGFVEVPPEADGETGYVYPIRDELLSHVDAALSSPEPVGEVDE